MEDNTSAKFEFLASFILPNGILDWFDFVKVRISAMTTQAFQR